MATHIQRFRAWLLAGGLATIAIGGDAVAQQSVMHRDPELSAIRQQIESQEQEIRSLRARLSSIESSALEPLPPVGFGEVSEGPMATSVAEQKEGKEKKSVDARVADIEESDEEGRRRGQEEEARGRQKAQSIKIRGRVHTDMATFDQEPASRVLNGDIQDGADFRRARIGVEGTMLEVSNYRIEMDFAGSGRPSFTDVYWGISELPYINNVRAGHLQRGLQPGRAHQLELHHVHGAQPAQRVRSGA